MSTEVGDLAALEAAIARTNAELAQLRAATYQGQDPARLVTAVVDGEGVVVRVTFVPAIGRYDPAAVGDAVRAAVSAAQQRLGQAVGALAARVAPVDQDPARDATGFSGAIPEGDEG